MAFKAYLKADNDVLLPAVLGLVVVCLTVAILSRKSVARWSPDDLASPTGYGTPKSPETVAEKIEEKTPGSVKNLKKEAASVAEKVAEKVEKVATPVAEAVAPKRGPGRPPKTPAAKTPAAARTPAPGSPRRLRTRSTPSN